MSSMLIRSYVDAVLITASNTVPVQDSQGRTRTCNAIMVGVSGNVACMFRGNPLPIVIPMVAGQLYPIEVTQVMSTNTTATGIVGLFRENFPSTFPGTPAQWG